MKTDKNIDIELLFFYLGISTISFILYIYRHPIIYIFYKVEYAYGLIKEYLPDLIIFLSVFVPYIIGIFAIIILKLTKNIKISDDLFIILFFPILSFFYKGMSLFQIYVHYSIWEIFKDNFAFFSFLAIGPSIVLFNKIIISLHLKKQR